MKYTTTIVILAVISLYGGIRRARADEEPPLPSPDAATVPAPLSEAISPAEPGPSRAESLEVLPPVTVRSTPLPPVVVTGSPLAKEHERARGEPGVPRVDLREVGSRDVFGPGRVRETGARDVNDLVNHLPALSARPYNGGEAAAPSFSMRGLPDDGLTEYVHVLIDGVPASPLPYGWTAFSFLPISTDRIHALDYIRGAHSVRYSPNTVGGVLNFITEPIPACPTFRARATMGSYGYRSVLLRAGATQGRFGYMLTAVDRRGDGYRDGADFDQQDINLKTRYALGTHCWIASSLSFMDSDHTAPGGLTRAEFDVDRFGNARPFNRFDGDREVADIVLHMGQGAERYVEAFAYGSRTFRNLRAQRPHFGAAATISDWRDESYFAGAGLRFARPVRIGGVKHEFYGGIRYQREWIPSWKLRSEPYPGGMGTPILDACYETDTISAHLDDTFHPAPRWTVRAGVRLEWVPSTEGRDRLGGFSFEDDFVRVLPGIGVSYQVSKHAAVFANYYEGFRAPQVWGYADATTNGSLEFEQGRSAELGVRVENYRGVTGSVTGWQTTYDNFGVYYTGFYENLGEIRARGVDFALGYDFGCLSRRLAGLSFDGSLTLQDSELQSGPNRGNRTPYAWRQKASLRTRYERGGWKASFGGTYVGDSFSDDANTNVESANGNIGVNKAAWLFDARVAKSLRLNRRAALELAVGVTNLFDKEWEVHSRGGFFGGGLVAGPPRQAYVSLDLNLDI